MDDLIEALQILRKYLPEKGNYCPTNCSHDELRIMDIYPTDVTEEDKVRLDELGFFPCDEDCFISYRFGSA